MLPTAGQEAVLVRAVQERKLQVCTLQPKILKVIFNAASKFR